ncbi:MAG: hypothetical protein ACK452_00495 [Bacteroidota bacterium]|jgi:hypothetical protein
MRHIIFFTLLSLSLVFLACKPSVRSAADYNNKIVKHQTKVGETQRELFAVFKDGKPDEMKQVLDRFKYQITEIMDSVSSMPAFDGKDDFKKAAITYLEQMSGIADVEFSEIVKLYSLSDTSYTQKEEKKVAALRDLINEKTKKALNELGLKQQKFAQEYHFKIE